MNVVRRNKHRIIMMKNPIREKLIKKRMNKP